MSDLVKATKFYTEKLGWKKTKDSNENITFIQLNGILLSLYDRVKLAEDAQVPSEGSGFKGFSMAYNTSSIAEVDNVFKQLIQKEVEIIKMPEKVFWGGYSGYFVDPDNNLWEVAYNPYLSLDDNGNVP